MNQKEIARRLRKGRELVSISQNEAAEALGLPRTAVTQLEKGARAVSTLELVRFAELYRRPVNWFLTDTAEDREELTVALHRIAPGLEDTPEVQREVHRCIQIFREGVSLEGLLGHEKRNGPPAWELLAPKSAGEAIVQGEYVAEQERRRLELDSAPVSDLAGLFANQGIWVATVELPDAMSGLFLHHPDIGMATLVNAGHARANQRFSLAHEYAHVLLDRDSVVGVSSADNSKERVEQRANAFAAAFLLPEAGVREELRRLGKGQPARADRVVFDVATGGSIKGQSRPTSRSQVIGPCDVALIAHRFGVGYRATVLRLKDLGYIRQPESDLLLTPEVEGLGRLFLMTLGLLEYLDAPVSAEEGSSELRRRVAQLALEAYRLEEISRGRLLDVGEVIGFDRFKLLELAEAARAG